MLNKKIKKRASEKTKFYRAAKIAVEQDGLAFVADDSTKTLKFIGKSGLEDAVLDLYTSLLQSQEKDMDQLMTDIKKIIPVYDEYCEEFYKLVDEGIADKFGSITEKGAKQIRLEKHRSLSQDDNGFASLLPLKSESETEKKLDKYKVDKSKSRRKILAVLGVGIFGISLASTFVAAEHETPAYGDWIGGQVYNTVFEDEHFDNAPGFSTIPPVKISGDKLVGVVKTNYPLEDLVIHDLKTKETKIIDSLNLSNTSYQDFSFDIDGDYVAYVKHTTTGDILNEYRIILDKKMHSDTESNPITGLEIYDVQINEPYILYYGSDGYNLVNLNGNKMGDIDQTLASAQLSKDTSNYQQVVGLKDEKATVYFEKDDWASKEYPLAIDEALVSTPFFAGDNLYYCDSFTMHDYWGYDIGTAWKVKLIDLETGKSSEIFRGNSTSGNMPSFWGSNKDVLIYCNDGEYFTLDLKTKQPAKLDFGYLSASDFDGSKTVINGPDQVFVGEMIKNNAPRIKHIESGYYELENNGFRAKLIYDDPDKDKTTPGLGGLSFLEFDIIEDDNGTYLELDEHKEPELPVEYFVKDEHGAYTRDVFNLYQMKFGVEYHKELQAIGMTTGSALAAILAYYVGSKIHEDDREEYWRNKRIAKARRDN